MKKEEIDFLNDKSRTIRRLTMHAIGTLGVGHVGGALSIADTLAVLYYKYLNIDPNDPKKEGRDRFVLSKGHAGPALYATLADKGFFPMDWLDTLNKPGTKLPSHVDMNLTPGVDMTAGSLGQGFSCAVGIAIGSKLKNDGARIYAVLGDGESQEGIVWEAAMFAAHKKLDNLTAFTDFNKLQLDGEIQNINGLEPLADKWRAFGWDVYECDGHDVEAIDAAITLANSPKQQPKPSMILLHTTKGKGVSYIEENHLGNHNMTISPEQMAIALEELKEV